MPGPALLKTAHHIPNGWHPAHQGTGPFPATEELARQPRGDRGGGKPGDWPGFFPINVGAIDPPYRSRDALNLGASLYAAARDAPAHDGLHRVEAVQFSFRIHSRSSLSSWSVASNGRGWRLR